MKEEDKMSTPKSDADIIFNYGVNCNARNKIVVGLKQYSQLTTEMKTKSINKY